MGKRSIVQLVAGVLLLLIGLAVFAIRLQHAGPYSAPHGGPLLGALGSLILGALLIVQTGPRWIGWVALLVSPVAIFPSIYSLVGEAEEVISLYAFDASGQEVDLRLWIVDREDGAWVGMPRAKALDYSLDQAELQMLRGGEMQCVVPVLFDERQVAGEIHQLKVEKYVAAQAAGALGLYPMEAGESTVALRLDPCT